MCARQARMSIAAKPMVGAVARAKSVSARVVMDLSIHKLTLLSG